jgi:hypothetical protein
MDNYWLLLGAKILISGRIRRRGFFVRTAPLGLT